MTYSTDAVLSTTVQNNVSPLYAQYEQCAHVTMEQALPHRMLSDQ
jgi:hypothetical protein